MKRDVYEAITARIMDSLAQGVVPWHKPWNAAHGCPRNLISGRPYRGINVWILSPLGGSPFWLTSKQAEKIGGHVKRGERGVMVVFWKWLDQKPERLAGEDAPPRRFAVARAFTVFNAVPCALPAHWQERAQVGDWPSNDSQKILSCERIVERMVCPPEIVHAGHRAFYRPSADRVTMPDRERFESAEEYYSTLFHELTHATGHPKRLTRESLRDMVAFGDTNYSKEALCAEMGAAYLCGIAEIENRTCDNSAGYIQGWLQKLQNDKRLVLLAAAQAPRAVDHIRGDDIAAQE